MKIGSCKKIPRLCHLKSLYKIFFSLLNALTQKAKKIKKAQQKYFPFFLPSVFIFIYEIQVERRSKGSKTLKCRFLFYLKRDCCCSFLLSLKKI